MPVRGTGSGADVPRKYRITRRLWRVRHWKGIYSRFCCRLHHWPRAGAVGGMTLPFVALGRWWQTRKGCSPNTSNRNLLQLTLPLTFSLPAACLKKMLPGNYQNICQIPAVTCETGAEIQKICLTHFLGLFQAFPWGPIMLYYFLFY